MSTQFARLSGGERVLFSQIATIGRNGNQLFINGRDGSLLAAPKFDSEEDAELELTAMNDQLDAWENQAAAQSTVAAQPVRRRPFGS
jgi:hypothetical protein